MPEITNGSVVKQNEDGSTEENFLMTFSQEEQEEAQTNKETAKILFSPEFVPYYLGIATKYDLTPTETLVYGFIRFYLGSGKTKRFYFSSEQLGEMLDCSEGAINNAISKLKICGVIKTTQRRKSGGGTIRFISFNELTPHQIRSPKIPKLIKQGGLSSSPDELLLKDNKIKENKTLSLRKDKERLGRVQPSETQEFGNTEINWVIQEFHNTMGFPSSGTKDRWFAKHLLNNFSRDQLKAMLIFCSTNEFAPRIGSVEKWWFKRGDIVAGIKSLQNKTPNRIVVKL